MNIFPHQNPLFVSPQGGPLPITFRGQKRPKVPNSRTFTHEGKTYKGAIYHQKGNKLAIVQDEKINVINLKTQEIEFTISEDKLMVEDCFDYFIYHKKPEKSRSMSECTPTSIFLFNENILFVGTRSGWIVGVNIKRKEHIFCKWVFQTS